METNSTSGDDEGTQVLELPGDPSSPEAEGSRPEEESESLATAARLILGATSLGVDALASWLRSEARPKGDTGTTTSTEEAGTVSGMMLGVAARGVQAALVVRSRGAEFAGRGLRTATREASKVIGWAVPDFLREPLDRVRRPAVDRMRELSEVGREELDRARAIARAALDDGVDALVARLADNRELRFVIRAQSATAAEEAVGSLRGEAARIDDRLEGAARRLLRRRPRLPAPSP